MEADLHTHYGLDLLDFFRNKYSWRKLHRLITQLPSDPSRSRYVAEQLEDDELADMVLDRVESGSGPGINTWSTEASILAAVVDRLGDVVKSILASNGQKAPKIRPLPRPQTAYDRARSRRARARHYSLVAEVQAARERKDN